MWLGKQGYKTVSLSDASRWVIRESTSVGDLAHVHPARNQEVVRRMKAKHLKTAIILILDGMDKTCLQNLTTEWINHIRVHRLGLSPVKSLAESQNITHTLVFLLDS